MTIERSNLYGALDPLPGDIDDALRTIDRRLTIAAMASTVPAGLADRVFASSSAMLPTADVTAQPRLRLVGTERTIRRPLHQQAWARLAMAASFLLACGAAVWMMNDAPSDRLGETHMALRSADHEATASAFTLLPSHESAASHYEDNLSYLLETSSMTSADLTYDIAMLAARF